MLVGLLAKAKTIVRFGGLGFKTNYDATDAQDVNARIAEHCCGRLAHRVTFVTNGKVARDVWATRFHVSPDRVAVISNGVEFAQLLPSARRNALKSELFGSPDTVVIGFVGRFQNVKRPDLWIALELAGRDARARFLLIGDGPLAPRLKAKVDSSGFRDRFMFTGAILSGLGDLYQAMDVLMHTSATESLPNAVIEAIGHGVFAVAGRVGDVPEIVGSSCNGALVPSNDFAGFVSCMTEVLLRFDTLNLDRERRSEDIRRRFGKRRMLAGFARTFRRDESAAAGARGAAKIQC
jgi:glycosyltransferase involved in cell wall biosynthesis